MITYPSKNRKIKFTNLRIFNIKYYIGNKGFLILCLERRIMKDRMVNKKIATKLTLAFLCLSVILTACAKVSDNKDGDNKEEKLAINIPTAATTGTIYPLGASIAKLWNDNIPQIKANSQASNGGIDNLNLVKDQEAQVSMGVSSIVYQAYKGEGPFEDRKNEKLRVITGLYLNPNQILVRKDSKIESLEDIKGKKFATGAPGSTTEVEANIHFTLAGIKYPDEIKSQYIGFTEATDLMRNKQLDGAWIMAGVPTAAVTEITTTAQGKLIPISDDLVNKLKKEYPWYTSYTIPKGTYEGQDEDVNTSAIKLVLYTTEDIPEDIVYLMTKTFWENIGELEKTNKSLAGLKIEDAIKDIADLPVHGGAMKYYKERGIK